MGQKHGAQAIFKSGPNIWFLEPLESGFEAFLVPSTKLLPERFINMARELFLSLDGISAFWNFQKSRFEEFWFLVENYCQNVSQTWRASYF